MLYNFPWNLIDVDVVIIEHYSDGSFDKKLVKFMNKNGFIILAIVGEPDYVFIKKNHPALKSYQYVTLQSKLEEFNILDDDEYYKTSDLMVLEQVKKIVIQTK